jgi:hypothetical protein
VADERSDGLACLKCVTVASKGLKNFKSYMARAQSNMFRIANPEVNMTDIGVVWYQDAEMVSGDETAQRIARNNPNK